MKTLLTLIDSCQYVMKPRHVQLVDGPTQTIVVVVAAQF